MTSKGNQQWLSFSFSFSLWLKMHLGVFQPDRISLAFSYPSFEPQAALGL
jgi:hypothetical protein